MREQRDCTTPSKCRSCGAEVLWVEWPSSGKRMPVDAVADNRPAPKGGNIVLTHQRSEDRLLAEKLDAERHDAKRNRYTSHFATCPNASLHRGGRR